MVNFALPLSNVPGKQNATLLYHALKAPILIRNDSSISEESKEKTISEYLIRNLKQEL